MVIDRNAKNIGYPTQLAIFLGLTGGGLIIGSLISVAIWVVMSGRSIFTMEQDILKPQYYNAIMVMQAVSTFFIFFIPVYIFAMICYHKPDKYLCFNFRFNYRQFFLVVAILLITFPLSGALGELTKILPIPANWATKFKAMELSREAQEAALININSLSKYIISLFIIAFFPALFEEAFFRAGMQNLFTRWFKNPWIAIIITSTIFSVVHFSFYGFLVRFALGVVLGLVFYYGKSLWLSVLFHFLFNGIQVTALYVISSAGTAVKKDIDANFPLWAGAVALLLLIYLFNVYKRISATEQSKYIEDDTPKNDFNDWVTSKY